MHWFAYIGPDPPDYEGKRVVFEKKLDTASCIDRQAEV